MVHCEPVPRTSTLTYAETLTQQQCASQHCCQASNAMPVCTVSTVTAIACYPMNSFLRRLLTAARIHDLRLGNGLLYLRCYSLCESQRSIRSACATSAAGQSCCGNVDFRARAVLPRISDSRVQTRIRQDCTGCHIQVRRSHAPIEPMLQACHPELPKVMPLWLHLW